MNAGASRQEVWRDDEKQLREREVGAQERSAAVQRRTVWTQVAVALAAVVASPAAAFAAYQARSAVGVAGQGIQQQDAENQLSTAVTAIGGATAAERVAGVTLLVRNVADQLATAANEQGRKNAHDLYVSALTVLANYLHTGAPVTTHAPCRHIPIDVVYAADELKTLLGMEPEIASLKEGTAALDLSNTELCGQYWAGARFDGLAAAYLWRIDLRGANLQKSSWGTAYLAAAQLQCADLRGADLSHATLTGPTSVARTWPVPCSPTRSHLRNWPEQPGFQQQQTQTGTHGRVLETTPTGAR